MRMNASQGLRPRRASGLAVSVKRCRECSLIYADPLPIPKSLEDHYGTPPEDYWASEDPGEWQEDYFSDEIRTAKRLLAYAEGMNAFDIGAGLGKAMRSMTAAGFDTWGLEPAAEFHRRALENVPADRIAAMGIEDYPSEGRMFDFVTFGGVLEHLFDPSAALAKALAMLKPAGIIHAEVPSSDWLVARMVDFFYRASGTMLTTHISPMHPPFHLFEFTRETFVRNGRRLGYEIAESRINVCEVLHIPAFAKPLLRTMMEKTGTGMQLVVYLRKTASVADARQ